MNNDGISTTIMLNLRFHGAAQTTTGSLHEVEWLWQRFLLDCGMFQSQSQNFSAQNRTLPCDAKRVSAVILSHAHIDHCGKLPMLVRQGFRGPIYATPQTRDLCDIMLRDSARIHGDSVCERQDVATTMSLFHPLSYTEKHWLAPGLALTLNDAGHIIGSATICLDYVRNGEPRRLLYTGDLGQSNMPLLRDPVSVPDVNVLISESTYGNRFHPQKKNLQAQLKKHFAEVVRDHSKLIIPAFSVGRTQLLLCYINKLFEKYAALRIPVIVDSPLSRAATQVHFKHKDCFKPADRKLLARSAVPFSFPELRYTFNYEESRELHGLSGPLVIISASGMCEFGRIIEHLRNNIAKPMNIVLFVEYQAANTLGRRILENEPLIPIEGVDYELNAKVRAIQSLSSHADARGLQTFFEQLGGQIETAFCVHGEPHCCEGNAQILKNLGIPNVHIPSPGQFFMDV